MDCVYFYDHLVIFRKIDYIEFKLEKEVQGYDLGSQASENKLNLVSQLLTEALKDRVSLVCPIRVCIKGKKDLHGLGLKYIGQLTHAILTKGPPSNTPAGNEFRQFWGKKSELRRVDGDLCECVVWNGNSNVCMQIVNFILEEKLHLSSNVNVSKPWYHILPNRLDPFISLHRRNRKVNLVAASPLRLIRAMDKLRALLRGLNDKLPLNITGILPLSSAFRGTSVFPPVLSFPMANQSHHGIKKSYFQTVKWLLRKACFPVFPLYVIIHLEQSGRWPNDLDAFRHMKRLLVIRMHELLSPKGIPSHVTVNNMLDIFLQGLVFRIVISQSKELNLIQKLSNSEIKTDNKNKTLSETGDGSSLSIEINSEAACWIRLNQSLPTLAGTLSGVSRTYAHVFPIACRLAKRWLSAQGYPVILCPYEAELDGLHNSSDFFPQSEQCSSALSTWWLKDFNTSTNDGRMTEVAVELLVLYASKLCDSVDSESKEANLTSIGSPVAAFLRFLDLLATYDWENAPLLVDLNEGFSVDINKRQLALDLFNRTPRCNLPALIICTPLDATGTEWTEVGPSRGGLSDLKLLASQSRDLLRAMLVSNAPINDLLVIFRPVFSKTDIVLNVKANIVNIRQSESLHGALKKTQLAVPETNNDSDVPMEFPDPGARYWPQRYCYDPLNWFVKLLRLRLGRFFEIRWDRHGGNWIALRWRPHFIQTINSKDRVTLVQSIFNSDLLDGLTQHANGGQLTDLVCSKPSDLPLVYNDYSLVNLLSIWAKKFIDLPINYNNLTNDINISKKRKHNISEENTTKCMKNKKEKN
ncbi:unnamed protein product [Schistosoma curassoni]|nr:unnamed protein product [Schistosoma curassoni]